ncbi:MAG: acyl-CoA thioesterase [Gammaproteobacteria bacterium]
MSAPYLQRFRVLYSDLDTNGHVANTSYLRYSLDTRVGYLLANGLTAEMMRESGFGPVVFREELTYRKELFAAEDIEVRYWVRSLNADGIRFDLCTAIHRQDGELAARVDIQGGWMNLARRRLQRGLVPRLHGLRTAEIEIEEFPGDDQFLDQLR